MGVQDLQQAGNHVGVLEVKGSCRIGAILPESPGWSEACY